VREQDRLAAAKGAAGEQPERSALSQPSQRKAIDGELQRFTLRLAPISRMFGLASSTSSCLVW